MANAEKVVWDFTTNDPLLTQHPEFRHGRDVVEQLFLKRKWDDDLTDLMTYALQEEFKRCSGEKKIAELFEQESAGAYPCVAKLTQLIDADTRLVIIDKNIATAIEEGERVDRNALMGHSVQLWFSKIEKLALKKVGSGEELYEWIYDYDAEFLGIMKGVLAQADINRQGYGIV